MHMSEMLATTLQPDKACGLHYEQTKSTLPAICPHKTLTPDNDELDGLALIIQRFHGKGQRQESACVPRSN